MIKWPRLGFLLAFVILPLLTQQSAKAAAPDEFKKNFQLTQLHQDELTFYSKRKGLMRPYVECLAAAQNDPNLCAILPEEEANLCLQQVVIWHTFYRALLLQKSVTPDLIQTCRKINTATDPKGKQPERFLTIDECRRAMEGFITKTPSTECEALPACKPLATRQPSDCQGSESCMDVIKYMNAIESNSLSTCDTIKSDSMRMLCRGGISIDPQECKNCKSFTKFIDEYYDDAKAREEAARGAFVELPAKTS